VAVWFLVVDLITGQPLSRRPCSECGILGSDGMSRDRRAAAHSLHDDSRQRLRRRRLRRRRPPAEGSSTRLYAVPRDESICFFEVGFYILVALLAKPLLAISLVELAIGMDWPRLRWGITCGGAPAHRRGAAAPSIG